MIRSYLPLLYVYQLKTYCQAILLLTLFLAASAVHAYSEFDIHGNTISFKSHDWFQVQSTQDYATFCEGFEPCTVPNGKYNIINLYTNNRYEVTVGHAGLSGGVDESGIITWTETGWHQVQDVQTLKTICEGGNSCVVKPGRYYVINHKTGSRSEVQIPENGSQSNTTPSYTPPVQQPIAREFTLNNSVISFTGTGWYQVQDQNTYASICEGFYDCTLPNGTFQVLNLTNGKKWVNVEVNAKPKSSNYFAQIEGEEIVSIDSTTNGLLEINLKSNEKTLDDVVINRSGEVVSNSGGSPLVRWQQNRGIAVSKEECMITGLSEKTGEALFSVPTPDEPTTSNSVFCYADIEDKFNNYYYVYMNSDDQLVGSRIISLSPTGTVREYSNFGSPDPSYYSIGENDGLLLYWLFSSSDAALTITTISTDNETGSASRRGIWYNQEGAKILNFINTEIDNQILLISSLDGITYCGRRQGCPDQYIKQGTEIRLLDISDSTGETEDIIRFWAAGEDDGVEDIKYFNGEFVLQRNGSVTLLDSRTLEDTVRIENIEGTVRYMDSEFIYTSVKTDTGIQLYRYAR